jgi:hypothetical protein
MAPGALAHVVVRTTQRALGLPPPPVVTTSLLGSSRREIPSTHSPQAAGVVIDLFARGTDGAL